MQRKPKPFGVRYPWRRWFARTTFKLIQGKHYAHRTYVMAQMIRNAAALGRDGVTPCSVKIKIAPDEKSMVVTVGKPKEDKHAGVKRTQPPTGHLPGN